MPFNNFVILCIIIAQLVTVQSSCPDDQIWHQTTSACCVPVKSCGIETEVVLCTKNSTEDRCRPCGLNRSNGYITSSFDYKEHRCFNLEDRHDDCPRGDTVPIPTHQNEKCAQPCRCDVEKCYYGDPCACGLADKCGVNEELDNSGVCRPCREGMYKPLIGCGPCFWNVTAWKLSEGYKEYEVVNATDENATVIKVIDLSNSPTTTGSESSSLPTTGKQEESEDVSMIAVIIVIAILVAVGLMIALVLVIRRKINSGDRSSCLVVYYYRLMRRDIQGEDPEEGTAFQATPIQETAARAPEGGPNESGMDKLKSLESNGHARPETVNDTADDNEATEIEDETNTTIVPLIGGTIKEEDETEQKTKA